MARLAVDFGLGSAAEAAGALELSDVIITAHCDGDFLGPHHDDGWPGLRNGRLLSFVYWFHDLPRRFDGGSLSLAGWNRLSGVISPTGPKVHLEPDNDTMVVFPSATRHELRAVRCAPDDFRAARFALVGFVRRSGAATAPSAPAAAGGAHRRSAL